MTSRSALRAAAARVAAQALLLNRCNSYDKQCGTIRFYSEGPVRRLTYPCPVEAAVDVFGGKWEPIILWWLLHRERGALRSCVARSLPLPRRAFCLREGSNRRRLASRE